MSCFLLFVSLISTFQIAEIERKRRLWAGAVDILVRNEIFTPSVIKGEVWCYFAQNWTGARRFKINRHGWGCGQDLDLVRMISHPPSRLRASDHNKNKRPHNNRGYTKSSCHSSIERLFCALTGRFGSSAERPRYTPAVLIRRDDIVIRVSIKCSHFLIVCC